MKVGDLVSAIDENLKGKVLKIIAQQVKSKTNMVVLPIIFSKDKLTIIDADLYENSPLSEKMKHPKLFPKNITKHL